MPRCVCLIPYVNLSQILPPSPLPFLFICLFVCSYFLYVHLFFVCSYFCIFIYEVVCILFSYLFVFYSVIYVFINFSATSLIFPRFVILIINLFFEKFCFFLIMTSSIIIFEWPRNCTRLKPL